MVIKEGDEILTCQSAPLSFSTWCWNCCRSAPPSGKKWFCRSTSAQPSFFVTMWWAWTACFIMVIFYNDILLSPIRPWCIHSLNWVLLTLSSLLNSKGAFFCAKHICKIWQRLVAKTGTDLLIPLILFTVSWYHHVMTEGTTTPVVFQW